MLATSLVIGCLITTLFLIVGLLTGWIAREYMMNYQEGPKLHPEFFDNNGNIIPDEVIAFRFENENYDHDDSEDED